MARAAGGEFLLRMEDTDLQRCRKEWEDLIVEDLTWLGLLWDGPVHRQSPNIPAYSARLEMLAGTGLLYPCSCSRADIQAAVSAPQEGVAVAVYPGTCRDRPMSDRRPGDALRLDVAAAFDRIGHAGLCFTETGPSFAVTHRVDRDATMATAGDVVLSRKGEDIVAYFLASAFDDADQGITHVVRGDDLFAFTPVQVILQRLLGLPTPVYHHHRLIRDETGRRLAKRDDARAIRTYREDGASPADIRRMVGL
jgi:glutamyl-Q tRNA(Asp) synthetase